MQSKETNAQEKKINYVDAFANIPKETFELDGDYLLVEVLDNSEQKTKSGLIVSSGTQKQIDAFESNRPTFVRVLLAGDGFTDDEGNNVDLDSKPGQIIMVGGHSLKRFMAFGDMIMSGDAKLALTKESEVQMRFKGQEQYNAFFEALNKGLA